MNRIMEFLKTKEGIAIISAVANIMLNLQVVRLERKVNKIKYEIDSMY